MDETVEIRVKWVEENGDIPEKTKKKTLETAGAINQFSTGFESAGLQSIKFTKNLSATIGKIGVAGLVGSVLGKTVKTISSELKSAGNAASKTAFSLIDYTSALVHTSDVTWTVEEATKDANERASEFGITTDQYLSLFSEAYSVTKDYALALDMVQSATEHCNGDFETSSDYLDTIIDKYSKKGPDAMDKWASLESSITSDTVTHIQEVNNKLDLAHEKLDNIFGSTGLSLATSVKELYAEALDFAADLLTTTIDIGTLATDISSIINNVMTGNWDSLSSDWETIVKDSRYINADVVGAARGIEGNTVAEEMKSAADNGTWESFQLPESNISFSTIGQAVGKQLFNMFNPISAIGDIFSSFTSIFKADGGAVTDSGIYTVGENGPETVYLPGGAYIGTSSSSSIGNVVNVTVQGNVWTSQDLTNEILNQLDKKLRLRGAY